MKDYILYITFKMSGNQPAKKDSRAWDQLAKPLSPWILDAINTMGFDRMTPVQASAIPLFMGNKDVVVEVGFFCPYEPPAHTYHFIGCYRKWKDVVILNTSNREALTRRRAT